MLEDKTIALFKVDEVKEGNYKIDVNVTDQKTLKSEIEFKIESEDKKDKLIDKLKENQNRLLKIVFMVVGVLFLLIIVVLMILDKKRSS